MAFGQSSGPPATARQLAQLKELLLAAGHVDFRDARGPLGLTQRQAGGKFTRDEAEAFIEQLEAELEGASAAPEAESAPAAPARPAPSAPRPRPRQRADDSNFLAKVESEVLAAELQRRGWAVIEP